jgi:aminopeptidase N
MRAMRAVSFLPRHYPRSDKPLTIMIPLAEKDVARAGRAVETLRLHVLHPVSEIVVAGQDSDAIRAFCAANPRHFHGEDGAGYAFGADLVLQLDALNPQVASRVARCFDRWRRYDAARQALARAQLERIKANAQSPDVLEVVSKSLGN